MTRHYHSLEQGCFRLLSFSDDSGLLCSLRDYKLAEAPPFIALSYTWGSASYQKGRPKSLTYSIELDGRNFEVQQNLHDALRHLGHRARRRQCLFWVDAICINQKDVDERNSQVKKMKEIYERADRIFAWLGLPFDEEETRIAVKLMHDFHVYLFEGLKKHNDDIDIVLSTVTRCHAGFPALSKSTVWSAWDGIAEMFNQPYWHRVWIYQEATTPGHIHFFCGDHEFDDIWLSATLCFAQIFSNIPEFNAKFIQSAGSASSASSVSAARLAREKGRSRRLIDLMIELKKAKCTNPQDKVYAPLGHATDVPDGQITVDYRRELVDVYIDVARFALFQSDMIGLEMLGLVFTPAIDASDGDLSMSHEPRMPSWVPDWRQRVAIPRLVNSTKAAEDNMPLYHACPGTTMEAHIDGQELVLKGYVANELRIEMLASIWDDPKASLQTPRTWYDTLTARSESAVHVGSAIRRSLVGDKIIAVHGKQENDFSSTWKRGGMLDWTLINSERDQLDQISLGTQESMINSMTNVCHGRRMAQLSDGRIAILPAAARGDDQIAAFHGGNVLYLVRRLLHRQAAYTFIGECYVDGLMDGAFADVCERSKVSSALLRLV